MAMATMCNYFCQDSIAGDNIEERYMWQQIVSQMKILKFQELWGQ